MVFKMEAALLQQPQWNMNAMMADNDEVDSDVAVSDDEGIEGFNVSPLLFFFHIFIHYSEYTSWHYYSSLCSYCARALCIHYEHFLLCHCWELPADGPTGASYITSRSFLMVGLSIIVLAAAY
jgi:hypothetical protein